MIELALTLALAALVGFGSVAVRDARRHAKPLRATLVLIAVCLGLVVGLTVLTRSPGTPGSSAVAGAAAQER